MIHVKDSLLPKGNVWSLDFLGMVSLKKIHSKTKRGDFQAWILQFAHIQGYTVEETSHENAMQTMKLLQAPYYMAVQSLAKVVKVKLRTIWKGVCM